MPVSKNPRRKKSNAPSAKGGSAAATRPDRRATEDAILEAQDVMYNAWELTNRRARVALARKALAISPLCADAYVLLGQDEAKSDAEALAYYRKGVEAGEQAIGAEGFKRYAGHFWGVLETRPYMRARAALAATLNTLGEVDAAIGHYRALLKLNPGDNQGNRYLLAACLMKAGDTKALKRLLKQYDEDASAPWLYTRALVAYSEDGATDKTAVVLAKEACNANRHVPAALAGKKVKPSTSGYLTMGGEDEAADYVAEWRPHWLATPGAVDWLMRIKVGGASTTRRR